MVTVKLKSGSELYLDWFINIIKKSLVQLDVLFILVFLFMFPLHLLFLYAWNEYLRDDRKKDKSNKKEVERKKKYCNELRKKDMKN